MEPTESEGLEIGHVAPLNNDDIPDQNQSHFCFSCENPMSGVYCVKCGQKNDDYRRSIFSLAKELITSITAIESRIWRTWAALLFKPGKVAREFANGRRTYWSSPIRVYLAMSILLFGFMSITGTHLFSIDVDARVKDGIEKPIEELVADDIETKWGTHFFETQKSIDRRNADRNFELIEIRLRGIGESDESEPTDSGQTFANEAGSPAEINNDPDSVEESPVREFVEGFVDGASGEDNGADIDFTLNGNPLTKDQGADFVLTFMKNPRVMTRSFNTWLPRIMFFMMPFTMLIGALFIRDRKKALLYDHLVHAAYIHAVAFFLLFVGILFSRIVPANILRNAIFLGLLIYLPMSLKKMFGRGWFKTIWTAYGVGFIYMLVVSFTLLVFIAQDVGTEFFTG